MAEISSIEKIKLILFHPSKAYSDAYSEEWFMGYTTITGMIAFFSLASTFISSINEDKILYGLTGIIIITLLLALLLFAIAIECSIRIFGWKGDFPSSLLICFYAVTPYLLLGWIPYIGFFSALYSIYLVIIGIREVHQMTLNRSVQTLIIGGIIFIFLILLFGTIPQYLTSLIFGKPINWIIALW